MWRCPVCRAALAVDVRTWTCRAGHSYDVAREGYVNLLVTHQRRARTPGDSVDMLRHRRAFLDAGHYAPLASALRELAGVIDGPVLDAGCGEGYYTRDWPGVAGVDIAKEAVRLAAQRSVAGNHYAVASVYDLPLLDSVIATAVNVFAPVHSPELGRVIPAGGRLLTATPGPEHLAGLKRLLFAQPESHPEIGPLDAAGAASGFEAVDGRRVRFDLELAPPDTGHLLGMVPYAWYVDGSVREKISRQSSLSTPIDFIVRVYRRL